MQGKRLVGVVGGVGHPKICLKRNIIKDNFEEQKSQGYAYAYIYPGMIKVLQASGRTIRSYTDKGVVLLIGDQFVTYRYRKLFPSSWQAYNVVNNARQLAAQFEKFW